MFTTTTKTHFSENRSLKAKRKKSDEFSPSLSAGGGRSARRYGHAWHTTSQVSVSTKKICHEKMQCMTDGNTTGHFSFYTFRDNSDSLPFL